MRRQKQAFGRMVAVALCLLAAPASAATPAKARYTAALEREQAVRTALDQGDSAVVKQARAVVAAYEAVVREHPTSGYCDNALWQAAGLERDLFDRTQQESDREKAAQLFAFLAREYPASPFASRADTEARRLKESKTPSPKATVPGARLGTTSKRATPKADPETAEPLAGAPAAVKPADPAKTAAKAANETKADEAAVTIVAIKRTVLPEIVRVSIELDHEATFRQERVENPARLLFDLKSTKAVPAVQDANWTYQDDVVRRIRVGRHPNQVTRVVLDLVGVSHYSVVTLTDPHRILIDCERLARFEEKPKPNVLPSVAPPPIAPPDDRRVAEAPPPDSPKKAEPAPAAERSSAPSSEKIPAPLPTEKGRVSMARQLGLGISRVVIDPGHGGHDPGAETSRVVESRVVLDIALRLEKYLLKQQGVEVVLTRRTDVFVPLEERTAIANREQADLFLSIHANASRNVRANGIESYYLNFASNADAEAVAARENAASERTMNSLPDILKAITLNNKIDESKDFAAMVQQSLGRRLRTSNKTLKDLGVKQAPFVVLIGASMPSVLAEVSFVTNRREGQLLGSDAYRQRIAEALGDAIIKYRRTLKSADIITHPTPERPARHQSR